MRKSQLLRQLRREEDAVVARVAARTCEQEKLALGFVSQIILPQTDEGIDFGSERHLLIEDTQGRRLWWQTGHTRWVQPRTKRLTLKLAKYSVYVKAGFVFQERRGLVGKRVATGRLSFVDRHASLFNDLFFPLLGFDLDPERTLYLRP